MRLAGSLIVRPILSVFSCILYHFAVKYKTILQSSNIALRISCPQSKVAQSLMTSRDDSPVRPSARTLRYALDFVDVRSCCSCTVRMCLQRSSHGCFNLQSLKTSPRLHYDQ